MDNSSHLEYQKAQLSQLLRGRTDVFGYFVRERRGVCSDALAQMYGIPAVIENMAEWMIAEGLVGAESVESWRALFAAADRGENKSAAMITLKTPDGYGRYWFHFNMVRSDDDGQPLFAVFSFDDFTFISRQFRSKDNDLNALLQATRRFFPEIVTLNITRNTYRVVQYDSATTVGAAREGVLGELLLLRADSLVPEEREKFLSVLSLEKLEEAFLYGNEDTVQLTYRRSGNDGGMYWMETVLMRQENSLDSDILVVAMSRSVNQQKAEENRLREEMRQQAEELRLTMMQVGKAVSSYDITTRTLSLPSNVSSHTGLPAVLKDFPESFIRRMGDRLPPESAGIYREFIEQIHSGVPSGSCEFLFPDEGGQERWLRQEYATVFDSRRQPVRAVMAFSDVTHEHAQAEEHQRLKENEYLLRLTAQHSDRTICHYDVQHQIARKWDQKTCDRCQLPHLCDMSPQAILDCGKILPESVDELGHFFQDIQDGKPEGAMKMRVEVPSGERRWFDLRYSTVFDGEGKPVSAMISHKDITEEYEHEQAFRRFEEAGDYDEGGNLLLLEVDLTTDWIEKLSGELLPPDEQAVQSTFSQFKERMIDSKFLLDNRDAAARYFSCEYLLERYAKGERQIHSDWQVRFHDGTLRWLDARIQLISAPYTGHIKGFIRVMDITEEKQAQEVIRQRSERDGMTGLYNRATAEELVRVMVDAGEHPGILILMDLDDLKGINDTFGHKEGDRAIRGIAEKLKGHFRDSDIVARIGGDEFLVYLPGTAENKDTISISLASLLRKIAGISIGEDDERRIHCSIGCAVQSGWGDAYEEMFKRADTALYCVKRSGKNNFAFYEAEMEQEDYQFRARKLFALQGDRKIEGKELQYLLNAITAFYPMVLSVNLSTNNYYMMEEGSGALAHTPLFGSFDRFIKQIAEMVHPDDREEFEETLTRKSLMETYARGETSVRHHVRVRQGEDYQWAEVSAIFYTDEKGDVCEFTLMRWAAERAYELEQMWMRKVLELAMVSSFEYVCLLDLRSGWYFLYGDEYNTHDVPQRGHFDEITRQIRDTCIHPDEREAYYEAARMDKLVSRIEAGGGTYTYWYSMADGIRLASFYWFEPTHTQALMTVQRTGRRLPEG